MNKTGEDVVVGYFKVVSQYLPERDAILNSDVEEVAVKRWDDAEVSYSKLNLSGGVFKNVVGLSQHLRVCSQ